MKTQSSVVSPKFEVGQSPEGSTQKAEGSSQEAEGREHVRVFASVDRAVLETLYVAVMRYLTEHDGCEKFPYIEAAIGEAERALYGGRLRQIAIAGPLWWQLPEKESGT
jgi:hypothetical protein